jgi:hypothetical protein
MQHESTGPAGACKHKTTERNTKTAAMHIGHAYTTLDDTQ